MSMTLTQEQIETFCSIHNKSNSHQHSCSITSPEQSKTSNDTGCETDYKNTTPETYPNNSISTTLLSNKSTPNGRNLIVNYLPQNMTEMDIHKLFSMYGDVESCKLIRSKELKQSLGYAFVKYYNPECAIKATEELNGLSIDNKRIKVSIARPSRPEIKDANLYVGGLPANCTEIQLKQLFAEYGEIISCRVIKPLQKSADYHFGFIRFDTNMEAQKAMQAIHGKIPSQHIFPDACGPITVKFARTPNLPELYDFRTSQPPYMMPDNIDYQNNILSHISTNCNPLPKTTSMYNQPNYYHSNHNIQAFLNDKENYNAICNKVEIDDSSKSLCGRSHANYYNSMKCINGNNQFYTDNIYNNPNLTNLHQLPYKNNNNDGSNLPTNNQRTMLILINLPFDYTELSVYRLCSKFGSIHDVKVFIEDQVCFSTVEMAAKSEVMTAASNLNGLVLSQYKPISALVL